MYRETGVGVSHPYAAARHRRRRRAFATGPFSVPCSARRERLYTHTQPVAVFRSVNVQSSSSYLLELCRRSFSTTAAADRDRTTRAHVITTHAGKVRGDMDKCWGCTSAAMIFLLAILSSSATGSDTWQKPGCHKVGHTRKISIPNCVEFRITTNACRGYCESWAVPSPADTVMINPHQRITSVGQCCNIMDTEDVEVNVLCLEGVRKLVFKSALSCSCYHCKKE